MNTQDLGARFRTITSSAPVIPFDSGNVRSVELPRSFLYRNIAVRLSGSLNVTVGTTNVPLSPLGLIQKLELVADGRKILWTAAGIDLWELCHLVRGKSMELSPPAVGVAATQAFSAAFIIENSAVRMQFPADSMFDPREYEKIELRVTWGTVSNIVSAGTATVNAATQLDVQIQQTTVGVEHIGFNRVIQFDEQSAVAASSNFTFNVPRSGLLSGVLIRSCTSSAGVVVPVDSIVNFVTLKSDNSFNHIDRAAWSTLKARNVGEFQLDTALVNQAGAAIALPGLGATAASGFVTGYAYLDLTEDGLLSSTLNTLALNVLQLIFDINAVANGLLRMTYLFYEPIRPLVSQSG